MTEKYDELFKKGVEAGKNRDYQTASDIFSQLLESDTPEVLEMLGRSLHGLGDYPRACVVLEACIKRFGSTPERHFFMGRSFLAQGGLERAIFHLERALKGGYGGAQGLGLLGSAYLKIKNPVKALESLELAVKAAPDQRGIYIAYLNALFVRAIQLFHQSQPDMARQMLEFLKESGVDSQVLDRYLASVYRELGQAEKALPYLQNILAEAPDDPVVIFQTIEALFHSGRGSESKELLQKVKHLLPPGSTNLSTDMVESILPYQYMNQGKLRKAIYFALKTLKYHPENVQLFLVLGEAYRQLGQLSKAEAHFERAHKALPQNQEPYYGLMMVHWQSQEFEKAFAEAQRLLKATPQDPTISYYLALIRCYLDKPADENIKLLGSLIKTHDPDPFLFTALAGEYHKLDLDDLALPWIRRSLTLAGELKQTIEIFAQILKTQDIPEWKQEFTRYLAARPGDVEILNIYIRKLLQEKDFEEAQTRLLQWIAGGHRGQGTLRALGYTYRMLGQYQDAFLVYRELLQKDPENTELIYAVILCLYMGGRKEFAREFAKKALQRNTKDAKVFYQLGLIAVEGMDLDQGRIYFNKALEIDQNHWPSVYKLAEIYTKEGDVVRAKRYKQHALNIKNRVEKSLSGKTKQI